MGGVLWVASPAAPWSFLLVTVLLGGAAAFTAGRALAQTWRPMWQAFVYAALLALAAGFLHYVLFGESAIPGWRVLVALWSFPAAPAMSLIELAVALRHYAVIFITLAAFAALGYRLARIGQMASQYGFCMERASWLSWRPRQGERPLP